MNPTIIILSSLLSLFTLVSSTCYFPNGAATPDSACNPNVRNSTCCGPGYACLSNNICVLTQHVSSDIAKLSPYYVRGSCTDQTWTSPDCPLFCKDTEKGDNIGVGGMGVGKCDGNGSLDRYYCRNTMTADLSNGVLCKDESYYFGFEDFPTTVTVIGVDPTPSVPTPNSPQSCTSTPASSPKAESTVALKAGLGAGLGFPLLSTLGFMIYLLLRRSRRSSASPIFEPLTREVSHGDGSPMLIRQQSPPYPPHSSARSSAPPSLESSAHPSVHYGSGPESNAERVVPGIQEMPAKPPMWCTPELYA